MQQVDALFEIENQRNAPIAADELRQLQQRSDAKGLFRLAGHVVAIAVAGAAYTFARQRAAPLPLLALCAVGLGFTLVTLFATMHEAVHRTAFKSRALNDSVAWVAGLLSFYNSTFYRPYHGWHHRYTQLPGRDPELEDPKPSSVFDYFVQLSGLPWWLGKLRTHFSLAAGKTAGYGFLNEATSRPVVLSVRLQLGVYAAALGTCFWLSEPYFVIYWLVPVALAQPMLRAILLAEHMGCSETSDMLSNTRTTYTLWPVRFLMWEMPYHADHHRYPALPFFSLARAHQSLAPHLAHIARRGYAALHFGLLRELWKRHPARAEVPKETP
jgi:fatty acid desaturase